MNKIIIVEKSNKHETYRIHFVSEMYEKCLS